jgi:hypothetical protein
LDDYSLGLNLARVHIVIPTYGGMDLFLSIFPAGLILFIFAAFVAQAAEPSIA